MTAATMMRGVPILSFTDHITKARQILRDDIFRELYILNGEKRLLGYIDITDALRVPDTRSNVTVQGFIKKAAVVAPGDSLERISRIIQEAGTDSAAVVDAQQQIQGAVLLSDIFPALIARNEIRGMVSDFMTRHVVSISPEDPIQKVYSLIVESGFTAFPVVSGKTVIGMVSRRDILRERHILKSLKTEARTKIETIMTTPAIFTPPEETLGHAAAMLVKNDISRMPVVNGKKLVGILDRHDILKGLVTA